MELLKIVMNLFSFFIKGDFLSFMEQYFENDTFDERETLKEKNKKRYFDKKNLTKDKDLKVFKSPTKKPKKTKVNYKMMDYDSEEWYE